MAEIIYKFDWLNDNYWLFLFSFDNPCNATQASAHAVQILIELLQMHQTSVEAEAIACAICFCVHATLLHLRKHRAICVCIFRGSRNKNGYTFSPFNSKRIQTQKYVYTIIKVSFDLH